MLQLLQSSEALRLTLQQLPAFLTFVLAAAVLAVAAKRVSTATREAALRWLLVLLVAGVTAASVTDTFMRRWSFRGDSPQFGLVPMVDGTAGRPFVYRRLPTEVIRYGADAIEALTTPGQRARMREHSPLRQYLQTAESRDQVSLEEWTERKVLLYHAAYFLVFGAYFGTVLVAGQLLRRVMPGSGALADFAPMAGLLLLPITYIRGGYFYDSTELLVLVVYAWCLAKPRAWQLVGVFVFAVLNKESSLLLVPITAAALWGRVPAREWRFTLAAQTVAGGVIVGMLYAAYRGNYGAPVWFMLAPNTVFWTDIRSYFLMTDVYAPLIPFPRANHVLMIGLITGLVATGLRHSPPWVRRGLVTSALLLLPLLVTSAWRDEVRNLSLAFPFVLITVTEAVRRLYDAVPSQRVTVSVSAQYAGDVPPHAAPAAAGPLDRVLESAR